MTYQNAHKDTETAINGLGRIVTREPVKIWDRETQTQIEVTMLDYGTRLVMGNQTFKVGSVVGYSIECGDDPVDAIDRARANGHKLVWINGEGAMIYSGARMAPKDAVTVSVGMLVRFHGKNYTIQTAPNHNLQLVEA